MLPRRGPVVLQVPDKRLHRLLGIGRTAEPMTFQAMVKISISTSMPAAYGS
jgi:hypothetical protein